MGFGAAPYCSASILARVWYDRGIRMIVSLAVCSTWVLTRAVMALTARASSGVSSRSAAGVLPLGPLRVKPMSRSWSIACEEDGLVLWVDDRWGAQGVTGFGCED